MIEIERMKKEVLSSSHSMKEQKNYKTNLSVKQGKKKKSIPHVLNMHESKKW